MNVEHSTVAPVDPVLPPIAVVAARRPFLDRIQVPVFSPVALHAVDAWLLRPVGSLFP